MASELRPDALRLLLAELEDDLARLERLTRDFDRGAEALRDPNSDPLLIYGAAALLESFYTGAEKVLHRIAARLGGLRAKRGTGSSCGR